MLVAMVKNRDWLKWADQEVHQVSGLSCQKIEVSDYRTLLCRPRAVKDCRSMRARSSNTGSG